MRTVKEDTVAQPDIDLLTFCQVNRKRVVRVRTVKGNIIGSASMKSLTCCQANRIKVGVGTVRRYIAGPGMEPLTCCQANRDKVGVRTVRNTILAESDMKLLTVCQAHEISGSGTVSKHQLHPVV